MESAPDSAGSAGSDPRRTAPRAELTKAASISVRGEAASSTSLSPPETSFTRKDKMPASEICGIPQPRITMSEHKAKMPPGPLKAKSFFGERSVCGSTEFDFSGQDAFNGLGPRRRVPMFGSPFGRADSNGHSEKSSFYATICKGHTLAKLV